ncbi:MAG: hypothetical protein HN981_05125 [Candidatus Pacebacteria bacterium]|mgnify:FL=1|jgi:hypothetical protein|nr:hypothetical protein [Candidatus Paceibacterota bacterium]MBT4652323.1 hypothetical protein [Candidatus Paceibacterota bacterium]MBT6756150.1 hypothetical protein [Candidatus Paceibacterota bacterium]MBT6921745.1 hypothetical protein [Candidatus Paceibacterota bacterium]
MSDKNSEPRVRTQNLDEEITAQPLVDEVRPVGDNQNSSTSTIEMKTLDLKTKEKKSMNGKQTKLLVTGIALVAIVAGLGTGYGAFKLKMKSSPNDNGGSSPQADLQVAGDVINVGDVFGVKDDQTFKDSAEGYIEVGGLDGEGSHSLLREGGVSQTVYLTSSITDLDKLAGMKVKVWGETFKGQKAGWLMDVGRVQIVETDAEPPVEE